MRPFRILGIQQIAIGTVDKSPLTSFWVDILGLTYVKSYRSDSENVDEDILKIEQDPIPVEVDIMQPVDMNKRPRVHEPALNHIGLWIDDLQSAFDWLQKQGVRMAPGGIRKGASGHEICFIHPRGNEEFPLSGQGVLIELVQAPEHMLKKLQG